MNVLVTSIALRWLNNCLQILQYHNIHVHIPQCTLNVGSMHTHTTVHT